MEGRSPSAAPAVVFPKGERRLTRRVAIEGALIDLVEGEVRGAVFGADLNADGMRVFAPTLPRGARVRLTFQLSEHGRWDGVGARVVHGSDEYCGFAFEAWEDEDRLRLLEYLTERYEEG